MIFKHWWDKGILWIKAEDWPLAIALTHEDALDLEAFLKDILQVWKHEEGQEEGQSSL